MADYPQVGHAPAHPLLLRQRDHGRFYPATVAHLHHDEIRPAPAHAPVRGPPLHQQVVERMRCGGWTMCTISGRVLIDN
jgi:hypothetical protein